MVHDKQVKETEVLIIGAGVIGLSVARQLTRYGVKPLVIEKESEIGLGISKSSGGFINAGLALVVDALVKELMGGASTEDLGSERERMLREGYDAYDKMAHELDVAHRHLGSIVVARNEPEVELLKRLMELGDGFRVLKLQWLDEPQLRHLEPNLSEEAIAGVRDADGTILVFGYELMVALYENAVLNGAEFLMEAECLDISPEMSGFWVKTAEGDIRADFVINCAGKFADRIADMTGVGRDWQLSYFRTQAMILDRRLDGLLNHFITVPPSGTKVEAVSPLLNGNLLVYGSHIEPVSDPAATQTVGKDFDSAIQSMSRLLPAIDGDDVITSYTGVRVYCDRPPEEHFIESLPGWERFINVVPRMPGFTPSIEIADKIVFMLDDLGLELTDSGDFNPERTAIPRFRYLDDEAKSELIARDPRFGHVVCRCEMVTEGEIVEAVRRGASTVQGVMFRTRAGMGRCQRNFCARKIVEIIAREKKIQPEEVTFKGVGSNYI